ncbi:MAG: hypothetical protein BGO20_02430 [Bosea sp. 67-29]|nr:MAG: hypothetical protein BGO20_02430 [Bosea sp. 67-29]
MGRQRSLVGRNFDLCERNFIGTDQDIASIVLVDLKLVQSAFDHMQQQVDRRPVRLGASPVIVITPLNWNSSPDLRSWLLCLKAQTALTVDTAHQS